MKKLKLLKDWTTYKADSIIEADETTAGELLASKSAEAYDADAEARQKAAQDAQDERIATVARRAIEDGIATLSKTNKLVSLNIDVREPEPKFKSVGEQLQLIARAERDIGAYMNDARVKAMEARLKAAGANEAVSSEGGFLVDQALVAGLWEKATASANLWGRCEQITVGPNSNGIKWVAIDESSRATGSRFGGLQAYWTDEAAAITASKPKFARRTMELEKLAALFYATEELLQDSTALTSLVNRAYAQEIAWMLDDAVLNGTGAGQPLGIITSNAVVTVSKESSQTATTVVAENLEKMYARLWSGSIGSAVWVCNQDVFPQLFQLKHTIGTGGVPVFMPPAGISGAPFGTLFGRPIVVAEQAKTLGTEGDIGLYDLSQYRCIVKGGVTGAVSAHVRFTYDEMAFKWTIRGNGQPAWDVALTPSNGSNTVSPFVTVESRS